MQERRKQPLQPTLHTMHKLGVIVPCDFVRSGAPSPFCIERGQVVSLLPALSLLTSRLFVLSIFTLRHPTDGRCSLPRQHHSARIRRSSSFVYCASIPGTQIHQTRETCHSCLVFTFSLGCALCFSYIYVHLHDMDGGESAVRVPFRCPCEVHRAAVELHAVSSLQAPPRISVEHPARTHQTLTEY